MAQPNDSSLSIPSGSVGGGPASRKTWQTSTDDALRRAVSEKILLLCRVLYQKKRPGPIPADWEKKLSGWAEILEREMYDNAATQEEYADPLTFDSRLQIVAKLFGAIGSAIQTLRQRRLETTMLSSVRNMMPRPAGSSMIPTSGNVSAVSGTVSSGMMPTSGSAGTMVPTPETVDDSLTSLLEGLRLNFGAEDE